MRNKVKSIVYTGASLALLVPALVGAQFKLPTGTDLPSASIIDIITAVMQWLLTAVGIFGVIGFAIAGILYLTSAGDETKMGTAKNAMIYSIIGIIVALAGLVALVAVQKLLGGQNTF
jgi:hypothetical protein